MARARPLGAGCGETPKVWTGVSTEKASCEDVLHHVSVHVGQSEVAPLELVGEPLVVDTEQVHDGGLEVMHVDLVLHDVEAEFVRRAVL